MALNKEALKKDLKAIDPTDGDVVDKMVEAFDKYIKGATITVEPGIPVKTTGNSSSQTGQTTSIGTATIS